MNILLAFFEILALIPLFNAQLDSCKSRVDCSGKDAKYRTIDGTCNNVKRPMWGSTGSPYVRMAPSEYTSEPGDRYAPRGGWNTTNSRLPLPRTLSTTLHKDEDRPHSQLNQLVMSFGQFISHGFIRTGEPKGNPKCCDNENPEDSCFTVSVNPESDPFFSVFNRSLTCLEMKRVIPFCPNRVSQRQQFNELSAFIDLSTVYGSEEKVSRALRTGQNGQLVEGRGRLLPDAVEVNVETFGNLPGDFGAGDIRSNQNPGLLALHTVWMREHNRLADELQSLTMSMDWDDEKLYQEARRINIAQFQNIVFEEYLPTILNIEDFARVQINTNPNLPGLNDAYFPYTRPTIFSEMAGAAFRMGHSQINGEQKLYSGGEEVGSFHLRDVLGMPKSIINQSSSIDLVLEGIVYTPNQQVDRFTSDDVRNFFPILRDLISRNIQRGRDFGLANYNRVRRSCGLPSINFDPPSRHNIHPEAWSELLLHYENAEDIDLFTGGLSEEPGNGGTLGATFSCIIGRQFRNIKIGDRYFFTLKDQPGSFSVSQIGELRKRRLFDVICDNTDIAKLPPKMMYYPINGNEPLACTTKRQIDLSLFTQDEYEI